LNTNKIVIVGGGSSGWMTAATLIKAFPNKDISVIESKDVPIIGVGESTLGGIRRWTRFIGLDEKNFFKHTDASLKLSIKFTDFYKKNYGSFHYPFGNPVIDQGRNPFSDWQLKKYFYPETDNNDFIESLFPAFQLFNNNKFSLNDDGNFDNFNTGNDVAYHFDAVKFSHWLKNEYCIPNGVAHIEATVVDIDSDSSGINFLILEDGRKIYADLYIDCTGFKSLLLDKQLKEPFDSYSDLLPNNSAWATQVQYIDKERELEGFTNCTAIENGWCWNIPLWSRIGTGYVYSDRYVSDDEALAEFKKYLSSDKMIISRKEKDIDSFTFKNIKMRVGIHKRTFVKNVVAIGLSAGFIEPLESNGLFSVHEFLFKLVDILQRGEINQFDRDMYNVSVRDLFDNFAKFVVLHYALSHRNDTKYWNDIKEKSFSDKNGDPYFPYRGRSDAFYNLIWRYMEEWGHPLGIAGITYISTGMNLNMLNNSRVLDMEYRYVNNFKKEIDEIITIWDLRKRKWANAAEKSLSLNQFLYENFYK
jgi:hypothetical protein